MKLKKSYIVTTVLLIAICLVTLIGSSYALFTKTLTGTKKVSVQTGTLKVDFTEGNRINLSNVAPMSDSDGMNTTPYTFTITNSGTMNAYYTVRNEEDSSNTLNNKYIKYRLMSDNYDSGIKTLDTMGNGYYMLSSESSLSVGQSVTYKLYLWLSSESDNTAQGQTYQSKIVVQSTTNSIGDTVAATLLKGVGSNGSIDTSDSEQTFITGTNPNNYIWYSGKLWRAVSIDTSDNSVKLITQWDISIISYNVVGNSLFQGSYMEQWLNDTTVDGFLENLREPEKFIKMDSVWNNTITTETTKPAKTTLLTDAVGLLNMYEYTMSLKNADYKTGYLNNGLNWWTMTPSDSNNIYLVNDYGVAPTMYSSRNTFGIRPVINLKSNIKIVSGNGTKDSPYRLEGDNDKTLSGTLLSRRYSGEYISFGKSENNLYRIVSHEDGNGTKITSAFPLKENGTFKTIAYGDNSIFSVNNNIGQYLNSQNYLSDNDKNMLVTSNWYLGKFNDGDNYKLAKYKSSDMTELNEYVTAKIGLLRVGELMCGHFDNRYSNNNYWTITKEDNTNIRGISTTGYTYAYSSSDSTVAIKPVMNLKSNVVITGGDGTKTNPFTIKLNN